MCDDAREVEPAFEAGAIKDVTPPVDSENWKREMLLSIASDWRDWKETMLCSSPAFDVAGSSTQLIEARTQQPMMPFGMFIPGADRRIDEGGTGDLLVQFCWVGKDSQMFLNAPGKQPGVPASYFRESARRCVWMDAAYPAVPFSVQLVNPTPHVVRDVQVCFVGRRIRNSIG